MAKLRRGCPWDARAVALGCVDQSATGVVLEDVVDAPGPAHRRGTWDCQEAEVGARMGTA